MNKNIGLKYIKKVEDVQNLSYVSGEYKNILSEIKWRCNECGNVFVKSYKNVVRCGCKYCHEENKKRKIEDKKKLSDYNNIEKILPEIKKRNLSLISYYRKNNILRLVLENHNKNRYGEEYGVYEQNYYEFLKNRHDSRETKDNNAKTTEQWVEVAKNVHPEYDFSKVVYKNQNKSVIITCKKHGDFFITPKVFLKPGCKCKECLSEKIKNETDCKNLKEIIDYLKKYGISVISNDRVTKHGKVTIILPNGEKQERVLRYLYTSDLKSLVEKVLSKEKELKKKEEDKKIRNIKIKESFFERVHRLHPELDFSKTIYFKTHDKVTVTCHCLDEFGEEHGDFQITPHSLLEGHGCKKCSKNYMDDEYFKKLANFKYGNKYDYSKTVYGKNNREKVIIICPKHGEFLQSPNRHLGGKGCPLCKTSHLEQEINNLFSNNNIFYVYHYHNKDIFGKQSLDFYIPSKKLAIECQGEQHYIANFFRSKGIRYSESHLKYTQSLDEKKRKICNENGIELIYFLDKKFLKYENSGTKCFTDKKELLSYLKSNTYESE